MIITTEDLMGSITAPKDHGLALYELLLVLKRLRVISNIGLGIDGLLAPQGEVVVTTYKELGYKKS